MSVHGRQIFENDNKLLKLLIFLCFIHFRGKKKKLEKHSDKLQSLLGKLCVFAFTRAPGGVLGGEDDYKEDSLISIKRLCESGKNNLNNI